MSQSIRYSVTSLPGQNNTANLAVDSTGYYRCILGGFNMCNNSGVYYPLLDSVKKLFEVGGIVRRRLDNGLCKGEYGHPQVEGLPYHVAMARLDKVY
jgi:hypothetical protein